MKGDHSDAQTDDLPDDLLLHIFSLLPVKDILKLRVLSKSFYNKILCSCVSCSFGSSFCFSIDNNPHDCSCQRVYDFMSKTLVQNRPHDLGIDKISFSSLCENPKHGQLYMQWIIQLFQVFHVHELSLVYELPSFFRILPSFAEFESLEVLKISMRRPNTIVKFPQMKLASVKTLHIKCIKAEDSFSGWISLSFPSLKHLFLEKIKDWSSEFQFNIQSSSLEHLAIVHCLVSLREASIPCIKSLTWVGRSSCNKLRSIPDLKRLRHNEDITTISRLLIMQEPGYCMVSSLFKHIRSARELHIDTEALGSWMIAQGLQGYEGEALVRNLHHIEIHVGFRIEDKIYITLLERSPNLKALTLVDYKDDGSVDDFNNERSVVDNFKKSLRDHHDKVEATWTTGLKKVKLRTRAFNCEVLTVLRLLMKSCLELKEISLHYPFCFHTSMMQDGIKYLEKFERASIFKPPPKFHFLPDNSASGHSSSTSGK